MSSWEGLWCQYEGGGDEVRALRAWAPGFRREAWRLAVADQCIDDEALAAELGERFGVARRGLCETFADAPTALDALRGDHAMGLVTNGASCLQREKLAASGLADRFDAIVVSGDLGRGPRSMPPTAPASRSADCANFPRRFARWDRRFRARRC
jgi:putative hydrolase of the HAD superfamily